MFKSLMFINVFNYDLQIMMCAQSHNNRGTHV